MQNIIELADKVIDEYRKHTTSRLFTVAVSGIDASGKGYITKLLQDELENGGYNVANINIDPWQNPIPVRLRKENAATNVYQNIFRWDDFFEKLIFPLQKNKSVHFRTNGIRSDADVYYPLVYNFNNIDILLIEGILLLKRKYLSRYDCKIWIECSFETGMNRAIERNCERLGRQQLIHDYNTYYYPAQIHHFQKDNPKDSSDIIYCNDELLGAVGEITFG